MTTVLATYPDARKRFRLFVGLLLSVLLPAAAFAAQPKANGAEASAKPLSRHLGLEFETLFNVVGLEEDATSARLRVVARTRSGQVFGRLGAALGDAWVQQPTSAEGGGRGGLTSPLQTPVYRARYLDRSSSRLLHVTLQPVGRSNLFRLELRLSRTKSAP